ncbi:peptide chain release factor-like protein [Treponema sp.]|uniref:peptide chain release factor-like protein n=1 Tax=Treponema sp. TaxID=166 RepID=UPI00388F17BC
MILQISSGQGPVECEVAVRLLFEALQKEFPEHRFEIKSKNESRFGGGWTSVIFETSADLAFLEGSVEWKCQSYLRPGHKRKNWFVDVSLIPEYSEVPESKNIEWQFFRCGGNGGQNVNKVETGVRLIHKESGIVVTCTEERSQALNRKRALEKLNLEIKCRASAEKSKQNAAAWNSSNSIVRGNPVRIYEGKNFIRAEGLIP